MRGATVHEGRDGGYGGRPLENTGLLDGGSSRSPGPDLTVD
jgi:hypothetical protein